MRNDSVKWETVEKELIISQNYVACDPETCNNLKEFHGKLSCH